MVKSLNDTASAGKLDIANKCLFFIFWFAVDFVDLEIVSVILRDSWIYQFFVSSSYHLADYLLFFEGKKNRDRVVVRFLFHLISMKLYIIIIYQDTL